MVEIIKKDDGKKGDGKKNDKGDFLKIFDGKGRDHYGGGRYGKGGKKKIIEEVGDPGNFVLSK